MKVLVSANQNEEACRRKEKICPKTRLKSRWEEIVLVAAEHFDRPFFSRYVAMF